MNFPFLKAKERLIRIMGTFDLATGHADTFDELLDSLESELRDVLGHYREALAQPAQEPVAWLEPEWGERICPEVGYEVTMTDDHPRDLGWTPLYPPPPQGEIVAYLVLFEGVGKLLEFTKGNYIHGAKVEHVPLYTAPRQRPWVDLTDDMIEDLFQSAAGADEETHIRFARAIEQSLKEKNT